MIKKTESKTGHFINGSKTQVLFYLIIDEFILDVSGKLAKFMSDSKVIKVIKIQSDWQAGKSSRRIIPWVSGQWMPGMD